MTVSRPKRYLRCNSRHFSLDLRLALSSAPSVEKLKRFVWVLVLSRRPGGSASSCIVPPPPPPPLLPLPFTLPPPLPQLPLLLLLLLPPPPPLRLLAPTALGRRFLSCRVCLPPNGAADDPPRSPTEAEPAVSSNASASLFRPAASAS